MDRDRQTLASPRAWLDKIYEILTDAALSAGHRAIERCRQADGLALAGAMVGRVGQGAPSKTSRSEARPMSALTPAPIIRASADRDVPAIAAIYGHHVRTGLASFEVEPPTVEEMARRRLDVLAKGYPYFVAESGSEVVGYAYASAYRTRPAYANSVENSVYVRADQARRGVGRLLLERLIVDCASLGYRQMLAVIGDSGNAGSIGLHAACGFARVGLLPAIGWKHGRWVDSVLMQRSLGDGDRSKPPRP